MKRLFWFLGKTNLIKIIRHRWMDAFLNKRIQIMMVTFLKIRYENMENGTFQSIALVHSESQRMPIDRSIEWMNRFMKIFTCYKICIEKLAIFFPVAFGKKGDINQKWKIYLHTNSAWTLGVLLCLTFGRISMNYARSHFSISTIIITVIIIIIILHRAHFIWTMKTCLRAGIMAIWIRFSWQMPKHFMKHSSNSLYFVAVVCAVPCHASPRHTTYYSVWNFIAAQGIEIHIVLGGGKKIILKVISKVKF